MDNRRKNNGKHTGKVSKNVNSERKSSVYIPAKISPKSRSLTDTKKSVSSSVGVNGGVQNKMNAVVKKQRSSVVGMKKRSPKKMRAVRKPKIITIRKKEKIPFPISTVFTSIIITALFLFMMMNYAELDRNIGELAECEAKIAQLEKIKTDLSVKLDKKDNLLYIEDKVEEFGMIKKEKLPSIVVDMQPKDKSEMFRYEDGEEGGFGFLLVGIGDVLEGFFK